VLRAHKAALRTPRGELLEQCGITLGRTKDQEARGRDEHERQVALFHRVKEAQARGLNPSAIAKLLGIARPTAYKYARMSAPPDRWRMPSGVLKPLAAYVPYIYQRWNEGCRNATQIYRELHEQGRGVSRRTVSRYMAILRREGGHGRSFASVEPAVVYTPPAPPPPSLTPRQAAILFSRDPPQLTERQQSALRRVLGKDAALPPIYEQVQAFRQLLRTHDVCRLDTWLEQAEHGDCAQLRAYALGLRKDLDAVRAGVREPYSQGPVEGHVHRIKLIKRSGYGRMSFPLLRQRVLLSTAS
jgi:transposase